MGRRATALLRSTGCCLLHLLGLIELCRGSRSPPHPDNHQPVSCLEPREAENIGMWNRSLRCVCYFPRGSVAARVGAVPVVPARVCGCSVGADPACSDPPQHHTFSLVSPTSGKCGETMSSWSTLPRLRSASETRTKCHSGSPERARQAFRMRPEVLTTINSRTRFSAVPYLCGACSVGTLRLCLPGSQA